MKTWKVEFEKKAAKTLQSLDGQTQKHIRSFLKRLLLYPSPSAIGAALTGRYKGFWRYRVGDYRLICKIRKNVLIVTVVLVEHRSEVYTKRFH